MTITRQYNYEVDWNSRSFTFLQHEVSEHAADANASETLKREFRNLLLEKHRRSQRGHDYNRHMMHFSLLQPMWNNVMAYEFIIKGRKGTVYEGGSYVVSVTMQDDYPFAPATFTFQDVILHPNVDPETMEVNMDEILKGMSLNDNARLIETRIDLLKQTMYEMTPQTFYDKVQQKVLSTQAENKRWMEKYDLWYARAFDAINEYQPTAGNPLHSITPIVLTQTFARDFCGCVRCRKERVPERTLAFLMGFHQRLGDNTVTSFRDLPLEALREMLFNKHGVESKEHYRVSCGGRHVCTRHITHIRGILTEVPVCWEHPNASRFLSRKFYDVVFDAAAWKFKDEGMDTESDDAESEVDSDTEDERRT